MGIICLSGCNRVNISEYLGKAAALPALPLITPLAQYRSGILTIFGSYFGRNYDFINSFWNLLTFSIKVSKLGRLLWSVSIRLHYDSGKKACWPFAISQKIGVGRCFVASRDISPGELILYDASVTSGPRQGKVILYKSHAWEFFMEHNIRLGSVYAGLAV